MKKKHLSIVIIGYWQASQDNSSTTPTSDKPPASVFDRRHSTSDESTVTHLTKLMRKNSLSITEENEQGDETDDHHSQLDAFKEKILNTKLSAEESHGAGDLPREKLLLRGQSQAVIPVAEEYVCLHCSLSSAFHHHHHHHISIFNHSFYSPKTNNCLLHFFCVCVVNLVLCQMNRMWLTYQSTQTTPLTWMNKMIVRFIAHPPVKETMTMSEYSTELIGFDRVS